MTWQRAEFKGQLVWAQVDGEGKALISAGRVPIRYSRSEGAKIYRAGASKVVLADDAAIEDLPDGQSADAPTTKPSRGSGFGSAGSRTDAQAAMAAEQAKSMLDGVDPQTIIAFTDGGCKGNPGPAGSGAQVVFPDGRRAESCQSIGHATNNIAELTAIELVLDILDEEDVPSEAAVLLLSDSSYSNGVLCRGWKAKANRELILSLRERLKKRPGVKIQWVAGHAGIEGNERADALANEGIDGITALKWV